MAQIVRNRALEDRIVEIDLREAGAARRLRTAYESGCLILLRDFRFDLDFKLFDMLDFDVEAPPELRASIKKYDADRISALRPNAKSELDQFVFRTILHGDAGLLAALQRQIRSGDEQVIALYGRLFPNYRSNRKILTWRLTETMFENMHWDNFHIAETFHQVRIFSNLDSRPRIWRSTYDVETFARASYKAHKLERFADKDGDHLVVYLNNKVVGGMARACEDQLPKHHIAFQPGEVWLCESRIVSHQIYYGNKATGAMFFVDPQTMDDPSLVFDARIARLHAEFVKSAAVPAT